VLPLRDNVPTRSFPVVTVGLIVANAIVWFWELGGNSIDVDVFRYGYYPCKVSGPCDLPNVIGLHPADLPWWESVFSSMFLHASWEHIIGNMLFLWIFGNNVEDALGRVRFWLGGYSVLNPGSGGGVAFFAHVGGFIFGLLTVRLVARQRPLQPAY
jgi:membrane associated rhomboid family serine protease